MKKNSIFLCIIIFMGLILRIVVLLFNHENKNNYFGHSLNSADMAVEYVFHNRIGVFDPIHVKSIHSSAILANKLVDPQDLKLPIRPAENLVPDFENEIGLGTLMGFIWKMTRDMRFIYIQIFQLLIDVFCIFLIFKIAINIFKIPGVGLISALLYAIFPFQVYLVTFPSPYPWMVFGAVFVLFLLSSIYGKFQLNINENKKILIFSLIGLFIGLLSYIRSTFLFLSVFIMVGLLLKERILKLSRFILIMVFVQILVLSPLLIRNYREFHKIMLTRGIFWHSVWVGWGGHKNPWGIVYSDSATIKDIAKDEPNIVANGPEYESILKKRSIGAIKEHPFWFVKMFSERILRLIFPVSWTKDGQPYYSFMKTLAVLPLFVLAFWGSFIVLVKKYLKWKDFMFFLIPTFYFFITTILIQPPQIKYVYPGYVFMLILSAFPLLSIYKKILKKERF